MLYTIIFLFIAAAALTFIFAYILRNPGPWKSFWVFLAIVFMGMFAFVLWATPAGPLWHDIAWLDSLLVGTVLALLLGAAGEASGTRQFAKNKKGEVDLVEEAKTAEPGATVLFGVFFWLFIAMLVGMIISGLIRIGTMI